MRKTMYISISFYEVLLAEPPSPTVLLKDLCIKLNIKIQKM